MYYVVQCIMIHFDILIPKFPLSDGQQILQLASNFIQNWKIESKLFNVFVNTFRFTKKFPLLSFFLLQN